MIVAKRVSHAAAAATYSAPAASGGQRLIYPLPHHPRHAQPLIRQALPVIKKAYGTNHHADLNTLTSHEQDQVKTALQAVQQASPTNTRSPNVES